MEAVPNLGCGMPSSVEEPAEAGAVFGEVYRVGGGAEDARAGLLQLVGELQWALSAELQDHTVRLLAPDDLEHVLGR